MKKFLSLVLSLAMTLSLVTISASATDYDDLSDKGEIQYEEAVAVLNKLGIITGYEDGSFKPTGDLTRGAAAKIIVSMMIGADAASALKVNVAPYKDVPVSNTFAAVISYCKTRGYINGYTDGTFRPTAALSGYAFSKMLLGALGYDGVQERFTGSGWTMNVASLSQTAGLYNDFDPAFSGTGNVNRQSACLLALNTLKATEVEYSGGTDITTTTGNATTNVSTQKERSYKVSNNDKINQNINKTASGNQANYFTLEFGEDHFTDLKLTADGNATDDFGRPSNSWSYKNVKIGTYPVSADYSYTAAPSGDTNVDEVKDMGLKDFYINDDTILTVNGKDCTSELERSNSGVKTTSTTNAAVFDKYTADGVLVEVYLDDDNADTIASIVVVRTQLMQVNSVKSSEVSLKKLEDDLQNKGTSKESTVSFVSVSTVKDDDDAFTTLKDLKADDYVLVVPVTTNNGSTYTADSVSVPQSVTGKMTSIATKSSNNKVKAVTVAGTAYKMSYMWTSEDNDLTPTTILSATTDTTVYLDDYGYAIYVTDVNASNSAIVIDEIYSSLVSGKIVKYAKGWDTNGNELSLNLGTSINYTALGLAANATDADLQGMVFEYESSTAYNADYALVKHGTAVTSAKGDALVFAPAQQQWIKNGQYSADVLGQTTTFANNTTLPMASDVKFIFLSTDTDNNGKITDVTGITVRDGVTSIGDDKNSGGGTAGVYDATFDTIYNISYVLNSDKTKVVAVVVANDDDAAVTANLIYVDTVNERWIDSNDSNKTKVMFKAYDAQGQLLDDGHSKYSKTSLTGNSFYTYSKDSNDVYTLTKYEKADKTTSVNYASNVVVNDKAYFTGTYLTYQGASTTTLNAGNANFVDLDTDDGITVASMNDMKSAITDQKAASFDLAYVYNGNDDATGYKTVSLVVVLKTNPVAASYTVNASTGLEFCTTQNGTYASTVSATAGSTVYVKVVSGTAASITVNGTAATAVVSGIFSFTMPSGDIAANACTYTLGAASLPSSIASVSLASTGTYVVTNDGSKDANVAYTAIQTQMENDGYTVTGINTSNPAAVTFAGTKGIMTVQYTFDSTADASYKFSVNVGGTATLVNHNANVLSLNINSADGKSYVKVGTSGYELNNATTALVAGSDYATDAYVKVTMAAVSGTPVALSGNAVTATVPTNTYVKVGETATVTLATTTSDNVTASVTGQITATGATPASALDSATEIIANNTAVIVAGMTSVVVTLTNNTAANVELTLALA